MKKILVLVSLVLTFSACNFIKVISDYDTKANFNTYKTFAFYKKGIDKASISDLDKRRIMCAIESELLAKGMTKSSTPDILVNLFTKSHERININDNRFFQGYWYPWWYSYGLNPVTVSQYTEETLFIDFIDANKKELVWQGIGTGALGIENVPKKEKRIKEFVKEIIAKYPPKI